MASLFSLPLKPSQQPPSSRTCFQKPSSKKRKREHEDSDTTQTDAPEAAPSQQAPSKAAGSSTAQALFPADEHQYRTAGHPTDEPLPGGHFPHTPAPTTDTDGPDADGATAEARLRRELAGLSPPLYPSHQSLTAAVGDESRSGAVGLRLRHLAVLNTILHRCLLEGDFVRAGRAWGLLLRSEVQGRPIDLRARGVWGIGAEILMRGGARAGAEGGRVGVEDAGGGGDGGMDEGGRTEEEDWGFSREGFDRARMYYERLILQYPYRRIAPDAVSALDFYPVMFGLWIYAVQEEGRVARSRLENEAGESGSDDDEQMYDVHDEPEFVSPPTRDRRKALRQYERLEDLRKSQLQQAEQMAARLDELLLSPPYSDSHPLLRLRGMMALWIGDLSVIKLMDDQHMNSDQIRDDYNRGLTRKKAEVDKAGSIFVRLVSKGATIPPEVQHLLDQEVVGLHQPG